MMEHKIFSLALALALYCGIIPASSAAGKNEAGPYLQSALYLGTVEEIVLEDDGSMSALWLNSERYGEYVMILSDETVWIDAGTKTAFDKSALTEGESVYVLHSAVSTLSLPPQSRAYAVVRNMPQDVEIEDYLED